MKISRHIININLEKQDKENILEKLMFTENDLSSGSVFTKTYTEHINNSLDLEICIKYGSSKFVYVALSTPSNQSETPKEIGNICMINRKDLYNIYSFSFEINNIVYYIYVHFIFEGKRAYKEEYENILNNIYPTNIPNEFLRLVEYTDFKNDVDFVFAFLVYSKLISMGSINNKNKCTKFFLDKLSFYGRETFENYNDMDFKVESILKKLYYLFDGNRSISTLNSAESEFFNYVSNKAI